MSQAHAVSERALESRRFDGTRLDTLRLARRWPKLDRARIEGSRPNIQLLEFGSSRLRVRLAGEGPVTLVFFCDPPNVIEQYDEVIEIMGTRHRVLVVEAPGFGFSFPKRGFAFTPEAYAEIYVELLRRVSLAPYVLVAPCVAAFAALLVANRYPAGVEKLVLMQATSWTDQKLWLDEVAKSFVLCVLGMPFGNRVGALPYVAQALFACTEAWFPQRTHPFAVHRARERPELLEKFLAPGIAAFRSGACNCMPSFYQRYFSGDDARFVRPEQPALVLWATQDYWHDTRNVLESWPVIAARMLRTVMGQVRSDRRGLMKYVPHAQFSEIEATGHHLELENPQHVCRLIDSFVASGRVP